MPDIFKALATIMAWGLWIIAWVTGLSTLVLFVIHQIGATEPPSMVVPAFFAVALANGIGAAVVMILRKKME
jgi:hypothetical protein